LREKTGRRPGGQTGHKGNTLKMVSNPDIVDEHKPCYCGGCGNDLSKLPFEFAGKRQVIDVPEIKLHVTEHRIYSKVCSCGHVTTSDFPLQANAPVSYGNNIESLIGYFHSRQYIPFKRMQEFVKDVFNIPISEGGIHYLLDKLVKKALPAYELIKQKLKSDTSHAVGTDETGVKVAGDKHWAWTWQNNDVTFISITDNRGMASIDKNFKDGFKNAVLVHDCWKSHFNTHALSHQICIAHLLRDLNYLSELYKHKWSRVCKSVFKQALNLKNKMREADYYIHNPARTTLENRLDFLINYKLDKSHKELINYYNCLVFGKNKLLHRIHLLHLNQKNIGLYLHFHYYKINAMHHHNLKNLK
jgi:transposase